MLQITTPAIENALQQAKRIHVAGMFAQADQLYLRILAAYPAHAETLRFRGLLAAQMNNLPAGIELLKLSLAAWPSAETWNDMGWIYLRINAIAEAIDSFRSAVKLAPRFFESYGNLGIALARGGDHAGAIEAYRQALAINPEFYDAYNGLGMSLKDSGHVAEGIAVLEKLVAARPEHPEGLNNLGNAYKACSRWEEAIAVYRRAIAVRPAFPEAINNMATAYKDSGRLEESVQIYRQAIAVAPGWAEIHNNLANALKDAGRMEEAMAVYRQAMQLRPTLVPAHSNLLYVQQFLPEVNAAEELREAKAWDEVHGRPLANEIKPHANRRDPEKRLRIGFISPDFRTHSVAYFIENLLEFRNPDRVETVCYSDVLHADGVTQRLRGKADHWRTTLSINDGRVAEMVRADEIDILVDLSGHTAANRLGLFARKPAPVQVSYLGYPGTTGLSAIDYRLTDAFADPVGESDVFYTEKLVRLPETFICFRPEETSPEVAESPVVKKGFITFGSFNAMPKMTDELIALWSRVLLACKRSRILLKTRGLGDADQRDRLLKLFAKNGVDAERVGLVEKVNTQAEHLDFYRQMDIALDTFPYNGTTTSCEALWMGVPVITRAGAVHRSRVGVSILQNIGMSELIATSDEMYVRIAAALAEDSERLQKMRSEMRARMRSSPLMDGKKFAGRVDEAYRQMWRQWCANG